MKTELTIEESAKLVELGVYPEWAEPIVKRGGTPVIAFEDILELLPKEFVTENGISVLVITTITHSKGCLWIADYEDVLTSQVSYANKELIDSLYQLLVWTIENKVYGSR